MRHITIATTLHYSKQANRKENKNNNVTNVSCFISQVKDKIHHTLHSQNIKPNTPTNSILLFFFLLFSCLCSSHFKTHSLHLSPTKQKAKSKIKNNFTNFTVAPYFETINKKPIPKQSEPKYKNKQTANSTRKANKQNSNIFATKNKNYIN